MALVISKAQLIKQISANHTTVLMPIKCVANATDGSHIHLLPATKPTTSAQAAFRRIRARCMLMLP